MEVTALHLAHAEGERRDMLDGILVMVLLKYELVRVIEASTAVFLRLVDVHEHLVEHEVEEVLIRAQQFYKLLSFDFGELLDFFWGAGFDNPHIGFQKFVVSAAAAASVDYGLTTLRHDGAKFVFTEATFHGVVHLDLE